MLAAAKKKQVHETKHLPKFGVTSMDIFMQVNAYFPLQLFFPTLVHADFKVKTFPFFYFPFQNFQLIYFLKSPMN